MVFCGFCWGMVNYTTNPIRKHAEINGHEMHYMGKEARCVECRNVVFSPVVRDYNINRLDKKYFTSLQREPAPLFG